MGDQGEVQGEDLPPDMSIIHDRDKVVKLQKKESTNFTNFPGGPCKPYPFCRYHNAHRYRQDSILDVPASGVLNFIEPCHEFKGFYNTPDESKMKEFTDEVLRFASARMNSRTNGTIHFGIGDKPKFKHGQVLGVVVGDKEAYVDGLKKAIDHRFVSSKYKWIAHLCIKPPRFVGVLNDNRASSNTYVIEVDIVPEFMICENNFVQIRSKAKYKNNSKKEDVETVKTETKSKQLSIRDGGSSRNILPKTGISHARDEVVKLQEKESTSFTNFPGGPRKPYPFHSCHHEHRYRQDSIFDVPESGVLNFIEPCHEFKGFTNTPDESKMIKFTDEVLRFASACMNSRTNGTIHFGILDKPYFKHGQVFGVVVGDKEAYVEGLKNAIDRCFESEYKHIAHLCIKPPRFVCVLNDNRASSDTYVIEVDIVPEFMICENNFFQITLKAKYKNNSKKEDVETVKTETNPKQLFIRDGASSRNILPKTQTPKSMKEYKQFIATVPKLSQLRKKAEVEFITTCDCQG